MKQILIYFLSIFLLFSCTGEKKEKHFLSDEVYRNRVHEQFLKRKQLAKNREKELFAVFNNENLKPEQREALEFLYASMPLCDLADYNGNYFLTQVDAAFRARDYFTWGKTIPEDIFRHFVLVYRVNNENLDTARSVFFEELKGRIKGMTMEQAALEVNHWCHEKVTYRGTDGRTSAPLALLKTSWGRCGEESTFTAAALRAVGIPARQCYTPRWAHTDDNHAWVEVWINGKWHYLGACEPEAELDVAWFTAPSKRAMMVHTNVFGIYQGQEEKTLETPLYSKLNLLNNYTTVRKLTVTVQDENDQAVEGANVLFKVYNYAQLYPIAEIKTAKNGVASLTTGLGDLVVWATHGSSFGYEKSAFNQNELQITLNKHMGKSYDETMEIVPPAEQKIKEIAAEKQAENARRFVAEDSMRSSYMSTFMSKDEAEKLSEKLQLDTEKVWKYMEASQGNWQEIATFIQDHQKEPYLFPFLASLTEKDLRDTPASYLKDFLNNSTIAKLPKEASQNREFWAENVLSPRIGNELIKPWRAILGEQLGKDKKLTTASQCIEWIKSNIQLKDEENYYNCPLTPMGTYELRISETRSRNIFFVAACRSLGIPARIEAATRKPQYFENGKWLTAVFEALEPIPSSIKAKVILTNNATNSIKPQYELHYTLARFENGEFSPLDYADEPALKKYPASLSPDTGYYRLMIGTRANDGSVTTQTTYFSLSKDEHKMLDIKLPEVKGKVQVLGIVDMNTIVQLADKTKRTLKELSNGNGLMLCFVDPDKEPSKHVLQDLPSLNSEFETWNGGLVMMTPADKLSLAFDASVFKGLPKQTVWTIDPNRTLLNAVSNTLQLEFQNNFPLTILLSKNGGIVYYSEGYRIGIGENVIKMIKLQEKKITK